MSAKTHLEVRAKNKVGMARRKKRRRRKRHTLGNNKDRAHKKKKKKAQEKGVGRASLFMVAGRVVARRVCPVRW
jgi:hypothetical protein